jgi:hypothetical protein
MYLPALEALDGTELGLAFVNTGSTEAQVTVTARTYQGALIADTPIVNPSTLKVPVSGQLEIRLADLFGPGISNQHGWLEVTPSTSAVKAFSFFFDSALSFVEGAGLTSTTSTQLVFPKMSMTSGTTLLLINTSLQPVEATMSLYDNAGNLARVASLSLPGLSGFSRSISEFSQVDAEFEGYALVQTTGSEAFAPSTLVGFETYRNRSDIAVMRGIPASARIKNGYWSHFASQGGYSTRLTLINTTDTAQMLQITAGIPETVTAARTLLPHERHEETVAAIFGFSGSFLITGDIRFETQTDTPGVVGVLDYGTTDGASLSAAEPQLEPQSDFYFTHLAEGAGYYTGLAFLNPNPDESTVLLDLFDKSGMVKASTTVELSAGQRRAGLVNEFFQEFFQDSVNQIGGYIRVSSTQPIFGQELLGGSDATAFLAAVPPQADLIRDTSSATSGSNPAPSITSISPSAVVTNSIESLNVRISGNGFTSTSTVSYDGEEMKTTFINSTLLVITLLNPQANAGTYSIQVSNPTPGGGLSNVATLVLASGTLPANQPPVVSAGPGATYYVSNSGSDSNSGTSQSSPWKTIAKVQSFLGNLRPGDRVLFERGGIWYEQLTVNNVNGASGLPITFATYGSGSLPVIDGGGTKSGNIVSGGRDWCIGGSSSRMSYITIDGFECRNTSAYGVAFVGVSSGSAGITVQNSYIHDTGNGDTGYHNQLMFAEYNYGHAYGTKFLNNKVGNCYGHNCIQIHGDTGNPLIRGNECYGFSHNCIDLKYVQGAVVDSNIVHDGLGIQQYENAFYLQNETASYTADVTWTHNVVYGSNVTTAFQCQEAGGPVNCRVYHNTVYANATGVFGGASTGNFSNIQIYVKNNIFDTTRPKDGGGNVEWDYNDNAQSSPIGPHDIQVNPQYVNAAAHDFHLQSGSGVIDKGINVNLPYSGKAPDLGAFEIGLP